MVARELGLTEFIGILNWARKNRIKLGAEMTEQIRLACYAREHPHLKEHFLYVANDRKTTQLNGQLLKLMGLFPGASDIFIPLARGPYHGMWLELKAGRNKPTVLQLAFIDAMVKSGYHAVWRTGFLAARTAIEDYLNLDAGLAG